MPRTPNYVCSLEELAKAMGVSVRAVQRWAKAYADWPEKCRQGYDLTAIDAFALRNGLGPYRGGTANTSGNGKETLAEARRRLTTEKADREGVLRRSDEITLAMTEGRILLADDVHTFFVQTVETAKAFWLEATDRVDAALPEGLDSDLRQRTLGAVERTAHTAIREIARLLTKGVDHAVE